MNADEARRNAKGYIGGLNREHKKWRKEEDKRIAQAIIDRKKVRWEPFLKEIHDKIAIVSLKGGRDLSFEDMISFRLADEILFWPMKEYLESEGFKCEEYQGWLLKISW